GCRDGPTPRFPLETFMAGRPLRMGVGRPPRVPHDRRGGNLGPVGVRGPSDRRYDYPAPGSSRQPHVRGSRKARRGPGPRRRERAVRRSVRKERGYHLVALAGYANAGKSSLLNVLADERVLVDDRMFSTLSTTTRSLTGTRKRILLTDTIGFVDGVPFWMVEAFNATLEEILQADLVLLFVDVSV